MKKNNFIGIEMNDNFLNLSMNQRKSWSLLMALKRTFPLRFAGLAHARSSK